MVCKKAVVKESRGRSYEYNGYTDGKARYRIFDQCPKTELNQTLITKCSGGENDAFMDYVWVSDQISGKIYQNHYCAQCHGVTNFVEWKLRAECSILLLSRHNADYIDNVLSTDLCRLTNEAPATEYAVTDKYRCFESSVESCPTASIMNDNHKLCERFTYHYMQPGVQLVYKNIFCYMCFGGKEAGEIFSVCPRTISDLRSSPTQFNVLVSWNRKDDQRQINDRQCGIDEVYDKYKAICRSLKCPFPSEPYHGQCTDFFSNASGIAIEVHYNLEILWNSSSLSVEDLNAYDETTLGLKLYSKVKQLIGFSKRVCYPCQVNILQYSDDIYETSKIQYHSLTSTNAACRLDDLYKRLINIQNKEFRIDTDVSSFLTLKVHLDKRPIDEVMSTMHKSIYFEKMDICVPAHILKDENYCPQIEVQYSEIKALEKNGRLAKKLIYNNEAIHDNKTIDVCLEDYMFDMSHVHSAAESLKLWLTVILAISSTLRSLGNAIQILHE